MRINKARRLNNEKWYLKISIKKSVINIKLVTGLTISECKSKNDGSRLANRTEGINIIETRGLMVSFLNKSY